MGREESLPGSLAESSEILNSNLVLHPQFPLGNLKCDVAGSCGCRLQTLEQPLEKIKKNKRAKREDKMFS